MTLSRFQYLRRIALFVLIVAVFLILLVVRSAEAQRPTTLSRPSAWG